MKSPAIGNVANMKYIRTPCHGHRILSFCFKRDIEWCRSYFKSNTSLPEEEECKVIVDEAIDEVSRLRNRTFREK